MASRQPRTPGRRAGRLAGRLTAVVALTVGLLLALGAWATLVWLAIESGRDARSGRPGAWSQLAYAGAGAVVCLFVALVLTERLRRVASTRTAAQSAGTRRR